MNDRAIPLTDEELIELRRKYDEMLNPMGYSTGDTCENCDRRWICTYVWDAANTDGDCILE